MANRPKTFPEDVLYKCRQSYGSSRVMNYVQMFPVVRLTEGLWLESGAITGGDVIAFDIVIFLLSQQGSV